LDSFMNRTLDKVATLSDTERLDLETRFKSAMVTARSIFGEAAFCKQQDYKRINKALFEVIAVAFAKLNNNQRAMLIQNKKAFKNSFYKAIPNDFGNSLTSNTGGKSNITQRHRVFSALVNDAINS